jgi:hypothetical protein
MTISAAEVPRTTMYLKIRPMPGPQSSAVTAVRDGIPAIAHMSAEATGRETRLSCHRYLSTTALAGELQAAAFDRCTR